jgi:O-antigen/teichoic acid export membrane protein
MVGSLAMKNLVFFLLSIVAAGWGVVWIRGPDERRAFRDLAGSGAGLAVLYAFGLFSGSLERVVIGAYLPIGDVTQYAVPQQVLNAAAAVILSIGPVLYSSFARLQAGEPEQVAPLHRVAMGVVLPAAGLIAAGLVVCGPEFLQWWLQGRHFDQGVAVLLILCVWLVLVCAQAVTSVMLQAAKGMRWAVGACVGSVAVQVMGAALLVRPFGLSGVAAASVASGAIGLTIVMLGALRTGLLKPRDLVSGRAMSSLLALGGAAAAGVWLKGVLRAEGSPWVLVATGAGGAVAAALLWRIALDASTRDAVRSAYNRPTL